MELREFLKTLKESGVDAISARAAAEKKYGNDAVDACFKEFYAEVERVAATVIENRNDAKEIVELCTLAGCKERAADFIFEGKKIEEVRAAILASRKENFPAQSATVTVDQKDKTRELIQDIMVARTLPEDKTGLSKERIADLKKSGMFGAMLSTFARACLADAGINASRMSDSQVLTTRTLVGNTSDDFSYALTGGVEKIAIKAFEMADVTWNQWCSTSDVSNYKTTSLVDMSGVSAIAEIPKGQPAKRVSIKDSAESMKLIDVGAEFVIDNQAIANDDLDVLKVAMRLSMGMSTKINALAVGQLASTMADNKALFHSDHKNLGSTAAISDTTISELVTLLGLMKDSNSNVLRLKGRNFLVSQTKYATALKYLSPLMAGLADSTANTSTFRGMFNVIPEPEIDGQIATTSYFLLPDPNVADTVIIFFKDGQRAPELTEEVSTHGNPLGLSWRITLPVQAKAASYRSMVKNVGA